MLNGLIDASPKLSSKYFHPNLQAKANQLAKDLQKSLTQNSDNKIDAYKRQCLLNILNKANNALLNSALDGIAEYRSHPYKRDITDPPAIWANGCCRLLDYGSYNLGYGKTNNITTKPVLFIPSLVNRAYILDLMQDHSLLRWLTKNDLHPYLLDWGEMGKDEIGLGLEGYIMRLCQAFDHIYAIHKKPISIAGYCMGGLLALALGILRQENISKLALMATPWDFHQPNSYNGKILANYSAINKSQLENDGYLSTDILQSFFMALDPILSLKKFTKFAKYDMDSPKARHFIAIEDWLNDGVSLEAKTASQCLTGWYGDNQPFNNQWQVGGKIIAPEYFNKPTLAIIPSGDKIIPIKSAKALSDKLKNVKVINPPLGHIGMIIGNGARDATWNNLLNFFN